MTALILLALVGNLPLLAAVIGHVRAHRIQDELDDIDRITEAFGLSWHEPTPPTPLRAVAWPVRQSPTDVAAAYEPVPWTDPDWAVNELRYILAAHRQYQELRLAA